jgi:uncharacterized protein YaaW (UPF0174 family)
VIWLQRQKAVQIERKLDRFTRTIAGQSQLVWSDAMPQFDPELVQVMRRVLEDAMTRVPLEVSGTTAKAYLAEAILKAAAQGHTSYSELLAAASDQIQAIVGLFT